MVAGIKASFIQTIVILHVNDIMACSRILVEDVLENIFEDEQSLDDSDSEDDEDIYYGYLGAFVVPHGELEGESRHLPRRILDISGGVNEASSQDEDEFDDDFGGEFDEPSLMKCDDDGRANVMLTEVQVLKTNCKMKKLETNLKMKHQLKLYRMAQNVGGGKHW